MRYTNPTGRSEVIARLREAEGWNDKRFATPVVHDCGEERTECECRERRTTTSRKITTMLIDTIKAEYLTQRKARATANVASLSTLLGEIETLAKGGKGELTDAVVVTVVKKFIKNINDTIAANMKSGAEADLLKRAAVVELLVAERALYEQFLPKQLTEAELQALIDGMCVAGAKDVGDVMKLLKAEHAGTYDGAVASKLLKIKFSK